MRENIKEKRKEERLFLFVSCGGSSATEIQPFVLAYQLQLFAISISSSWGSVTYAYFHSHSVLVKSPVVVSPSPLKMLTVLSKNAKFPVEFVLYTTAP